jgi:hypothetical protein
MEHRRNEGEHHDFALPPMLGNPPSSEWTGDRYQSRRKTCENFTFGFSYYSGRNRKE